MGELKLEDKVCKQLAARLKRENATVSELRGARPWREQHRHLTELRSEIESVTARGVDPHSKSANVALDSVSCEEAGRIVASAIGRLGCPDHVSSAEREGDFTALCFVSEAAASAFRQSLTTELLRLYPAFARYSAALDPAALLGKQHSARTLVAMLAEVVSGACASSNRDLQAAQAREATTHLQDLEFPQAFEPFRSSRYRSPAPSNWAPSSGNEGRLAPDYSNVGAALGEGLITIRPTPEVHTPYSEAARVATGLPPGSRAQDST